ncbi:hypothetical protein [Halapricum desulfuricans]|uniref:Uncharacterized protein n=1 Tax=Halapricum desulfuricans TaxID=2841257 RepID=A0A897N3F6_9EURY|nr:hypothetical protein [Halapricum desulfuricans]QSG05833.1 Uncharacterized protein HSR121_1490 [Halapricum desulfuricans]
MRPIARNFLLGVLAVVVLLLALGALPGLLESGDPYYLTATPVGADESTADHRSGAVDAANLSERRYEYTTAALADATNGTGYADPYWRGPVGIKGAFTHSPFDELSALRTNYPAAADGDAVFVRANASAGESVTFYRLNVTQRP